MRIVIISFFTDVQCDTAVFRFKQVPFSLLELKVFDLSKILCSEIKQRFYNLNSASGNINISHCK